jgi:hypothetical protein
MEQHRNLPERQSTTVPQLSGLNEHEIALGTELYRLNYALPYPLSGTALADWAKCISELAPYATPEILKEIINKFLRADLEYDNKKGIQNIFIALRPYNQPKLTQQQIDDMFGGRNPNFKAK